VALKQTAARIALQGKKPFKRRKTVGVVGRRPDAGLQHGRDIGERHARHEVKDLARCRRLGRRLMSLLFRIAVARGASGRLQRRLNR